jgi:AcrR family transcriptional regulator
MEVRPTESVYQKQHQETKEKILSSSKRLLLSRGFGNVTMDIIAKKAGLSRQRLYCYFHGLDEIIYRLQIQDMTAFISYLERNLLENKKLPPEKRLESLISGVFGYQKEHLEDFLFTSDFDTYTRKRKGNPDLKAEYEKTYQEVNFQTALSGLFKEGQEQGVFRESLDCADATLFWANTIQLILERLSIFSSNGEKHEEREMEAFRKEALTAFFAYLK